MPTYDYKCIGCGYEFELFQQMTDAVKRKCPSCGKPKLERLIGTGAGVLFKGGGFYETDYRSENYTKAAEADKKAAEGKSDSSKDAATVKATTDTTSGAGDAKASRNDAKTAPESTGGSTSRQPKASRPRGAAKSKTQSRRRR